MDKISIYIIDFIKIEAQFTAFANILPAEKKQTVLNIKSRKTALDKLASNLLLLALLGKDYSSRLQYGASGKPYVADGPCFNISHSGDHAVMAVSAHAVGIDIEKRLSKRIVLSDAYFTEAEMAWIKKDPLTNFFTCWTRKESIAKLDGSGFQIGFKNINTLSDTKESIEISGKKIYIETFPYGEHIISAASEAPIQAIEMKELNPRDLL